MRNLLITTAITIYLGSTAVLSVIQINTMLRNHYTMQFQTGGMTARQIAEAMENE